MAKEEKSNSLSIVAMYLTWLLLALFGGLWWFFDKGTISLGTLFLIATWVLVLNHLPGMSLKNLNVAGDIKYFGVPIACLATIGYFYGVFLNLA